MKTREQESRESGGSAEAWKALYENEHAGLVKAEAERDQWKALAETPTNPLNQVERDAYHALHDAAERLLALMDEVPLDTSGQNDRVFAHYEFDEIRRRLLLCAGIRRRG